MTIPITARPRPRIRICWYYPSHAPCARPQKNCEPRHEKSVISVTEPECEPRHEKSVISVTEPECEPRHKKFVISVTEPKCAPVPKNL